MSHFIEQEYQLTITYHQANYRHVTLKNTGKLQIYQNLLNGISTTSNTQYKLPHAIKETTDLSHFI
jgi:hypothetical protein